MIEIKNKENCNGCHACYSACPVSAITMKYLDDFLYPVVDSDKCIKCKKCIESCPEINPKLNSGDLQISYAAYSKNETVRYSSSSGGIFTELAEEVINNNGVVFGAAFNETYDVCHIYIDNVDEIGRLQGSKYVQSSIGDTYKQAKKFLDDERIVYFSGTPCQINGLFSFLGKSYHNLITQDIICHGVPSPQVWKYYLSQTADVSEIKSINFRDKTNGWYNYNLKIDAENLTTESPDCYLKGFVNNLYLRPSCYSCSFKSKTRNSDITLADFWGCETIHPTMFDNKGTSLVIIHSEKGNELLDKIRPNIVPEKTDFETAVNMNPSMFSPSRKHKNADRFMEQYKTKDFTSFVKRMIKPAFINRVKTGINKCIRLLKRIVKKIIERK